MKLKHTDYDCTEITGQNTQKQVFSVPSIMLTRSLTDLKKVNTIALYDKANLIRKWRDMP